MNEPTTPEAVLARLPWLRHTSVSFSTDPVAYTPGRFGAGEGQAPTVMNMLRQVAIALDFVTQMQRRQVEKPDFGREPDETMSTAQSLRVLSIQMRLAQEAGFGDGWLQNSIRALSRLPDAAAWGGTESLAVRSASTRITRTSRRSRPTI